MPFLRKEKKQGPGLSPKKGSRKQKQGLGKRSGWSLDKGEASPQRKRELAEGCGGQCQMLAKRWSEIRTEMYHWVC